MRILLTGGTGHLGRAFARAATEAGYTLRLMSRRAPPAEAPSEWVRADLDSGEGLVEALKGVDIVVHTASNPRNPAVTDVQGSQMLAETARQAGVKHFVFVSIIGVDRIPLPYYRHKLAAESAIRRSGVPCSVLRAAQFHYFVDLLLHQAARVPFVLLVPSKWWVQSIGTADVANELCRVVDAKPRGLLPDLAGPEPLTVYDAARTWLSVRRVRRPVLSLPVPGAVAMALRARHNIAPDRPSGRETWEAWLRRRYASRENGDAARGST